MLYVICYRALWQRDYDMRTERDNDFIHFRDIQDIVKPNRIWHIAAKYLNLSMKCYMKYTSESKSEKLSG